uniref:ANK_REP_REGION domain-containing protein n=1 Tax=Macrostomum lignano TaxID=282301 RepID=A0A1I8FDH2_9PLAT
LCSQCLPVERFNSPLAAAARVGFGCHGNQHSQQHSPEAIKMAKILTWTEDRRSVSFLRAALLDSSGLQLERQQAIRVANASFLLPREGIVNVCRYSPDSGGHTAVQQIPPSARAAVRVHRGEHEAAAWWRRGPEATCRPSLAPGCATLQLTLGCGVARERRLGGRLRSGKSSGQLEGSGPQRGVLAQDKALLADETAEEHQEEEEEDQEDVEPETVAHSALPRVGASTVGRALWDSCGSSCRCCRACPAVTPHGPHRAAPQTGRTGLAFACYHQQPRCCSCRGCRETLLLCETPPARRAADLRDWHADVVQAASRRLRGGHARRRCACASGTVRWCRCRAESMKLFRMPLPGREAEPHQHLDHHAAACLAKETGQLPYEELLERAEG